LSITNLDKLGNIAEKCFIDQCSILNQILKTFRMVEFTKPSEWVAFIVTIAKVCDRS